MFNWGHRFAGEDGDAMMCIVTLRLATDFYFLSEGPVFFYRRKKKKDSDHGQSVTSSLEYCIEKTTGVQNPHSDQRGITANGRNDTAPGRINLHYFLV